MVNLIRLVSRYWWLILLLTLTAGGMGYYVTSTAEDQYQSETIIYVMMPTSTDTQTDLASSSMISYDIGEYSASEILLLNVRDSLSDAVPSLRGATYEELLKKIQIDVKAQTRIIKIKATDADPQAASLLADKVATTLKAKFLAMLKIDAVQIIEPARASNSPINAHSTRDILLAALGGLFLAIGLVMFMDYLRKEFRADKVGSKEFRADQIGIKAAGVEPGYKQGAAR